MLLVCVCFILICDKSVFTQLYNKIFGLFCWTKINKDCKSVETVEGQVVKSPIDPCGFSKCLRINVSFGPSKDRLLAQVGAYSTIRFVKETEYV
jgi:hypothetical protein